MHAHPKPMGMGMGMGTQCRAMQGVVFEALAYIIYRKGRVFFPSLVCIFKKATKSFEVNVDSQKGGLRENFDNRCASFIQFTFSIQYCHIVTIPNDLHI